MLCRRWQRRRALKNYRRQREQPNIRDRRWLARLSKGASRPAPPKVSTTGRRCETTRVVCPCRREAAHRSAAVGCCSLENAAPQLGFEEIRLNVVRQDALNRVVIGWREFVLKLVDGA
jgi:hypothetical protein